MLGIRKAVRNTARRTALGGIGAVLACAGVGFLTVALALFLLTVTDPVTVWAILGFGYTGAGLLFLLGARSGDTHPAPENTHTAATQAGDMPPLAAAFMQGLAQGMAVGDRRSRD